MLRTTMALMFSLCISAVGTAPAVAEVKLLDPSDPSVMLPMAEDHYKQGDYKAALAVTEQLLRLEPSQVEALMLGGRAHSRLGNHTAARDTFKEAIRLTPSPSYVQWGYYGMACLLTRNYRDAKEAGEEMTRLDPNRHHGWGLLADAYKALGMHREADMASRREAELKR